ncbi:MAG: hypothetical protein NC400_12205 [Clostridium sp.]|nr:hypothetical protein [Clostridium sp.]
MATVRAALALYDGMTQPLQSIHRALNIVLNAFEALQNRSGQAIDVQSIQQAREELARAGAAFQRIEANAQRTSLEQSDFNRNIRDGTTAADRLHSSFKGILATIGSIVSVRMAMNWVQENLRLSDIQRNAERQLQTVLHNMGAQDVELPINAGVNLTANAEVSSFEAIKAKASEIQANGMFGDEAMLGGAAELATYFSDTEAIMSMMDTLSNYAAGMSLGQEVDSRQMVDYATNLGKIMTGTYTAMSQKGFQFSEAQKAIIEGTATQAQIVDTLGEEYLAMSADMQAAAAINQVITESWAGMYEAMSNTPTGKIAQLKNSFGDVREEIGNQLYPAVLLFVDTFRGHLPQITSMMQGLAGVCSLLIVGLTAILSVASSVGSAIVDNWDIIGPIVLGVAAALAVYNATMAIAWLSTLKDIAAKIAHAAASAAETLAIFALTAAQDGLNAAMLACPITWIVIGVIALIAVITALCAWFARSSDVAQSALGVMAGGINVVIHFFSNLFQVVMNIVAGIGLAFFALVYNIVTAFDNGITNVKGFFWDLLSVGLSVIKDICEALNKLPFIEFDYSGIEAKAIKFANQAADTYENKSDYADVGAAFSSGFNTFAAFSEGWASEAFAAGADWGNSIADKFKLPSLEDLVPDMPFGDLADKLDSIYNSAQDTASNTAAMADSLAMTDEDLQYMRDIAERDTVNRYTTAEIVLNMGGITNQVTKTDDLDGITTKLVDNIIQEIEIGAEGLHI